MTDPDKTIEELLADVKQAEECQKEVNRLHRDKRLAFERKLYNLGISRPLKKEDIEAKRRAAPKLRCQSMTTPALLVLLISGAMSALALWVSVFGGIATSQEGLPLWAFISVALGSGVFLSFIGMSFLAGVSALVYVWKLQKQLSAFNYPMPVYPMQQPWESDMARLSKQDPPVPLRTFNENGEMGYESDPVIAKYVEAMKRGDIPSDMTAEDFFAMTNKRPI